MFNFYQYCSSYEHFFSYNIKWKNVLLKAVGKENKYMEAVFLNSFCADDLQDIL